MTSTNPTSLDELFDLLSNRRRRYALYACKQAQSSIEVPELVDQVASWEYGKPPEEVSVDERRRVYTSVQQTHLPRLEEADVVERENRTIRMTEQAANLNIYDNVLSESSASWERYYLGLSAVVGLAVAFAHTGVYPEWMPDLAWAWLIVAVFLGSAVCHAWWSRRRKSDDGGPPPEVDR